MSLHAIVDYFDIFLRIIFLVLHQTVLDWWLLFEFTHVEVQRFVFRCLDVGHTADVIRCDCVWFPPLIVVHWNILLHIGFILWLFFLEYIFPGWTDDLLLLLNRWHFACLALVVALNTLSRKHIDWLVEINICKMWKVYWDSFPLNGRNQQETTLTTFRCHFHISDCLWWQTQAIQLFASLYVP